MISLSYHLSAELNEDGNKKKKKNPRRFVSKGPAFKSEAPGWKHGGASECTATVMLMKASQAVNGGSL